ncbi:MAG: hypothetical protein SOR77_04710, partial [Peptoniphilus sp.]|nr:hypothetical protein [Peptoniphilus sp.]
MKKIFIIICLLILTACGGNKTNEIEKSDNKTKMQKYEIQFFEAFDTVTTFQIYDTNEKTANEKLEKMRNEYFRLHREFDRYNNYENLNNLKTINDNAGVQPV